jgi:SAM-dependent methyltransferase
LVSAVVSRSLRERGIWGTLRKATEHLVRRQVLDDFDVKNGTDTSGIVPLWRLSIASPNARFGGRYHASEEWELAGALKVLNEDLSSFTFVDLGSGKGRSLLIAARMGFRRVIGVEFAPQLAATARRNIRIMGVSNATVIDADAAEFMLPEDDLVVFLFNPFRQTVVRRVVTNLEQSRAGRLYVIYSNPICAEAFDASQVLRRVGTAPARWLPTLVWKRAQDLVVGPATLPKSGSYGVKPNDHSGEWRSRAESASRIRE